MPTYRYNCHKCNKSAERTCTMAQRNRKKPKCPQCNKVMTKELNAGVPLVWDSDKAYTNFAPDPIRFRTQHALRRYCRDRGLASSALL